MSILNVCAVVCEYNPFHNGHAYQLKTSREKGATHIVAVMSGNYVQRGEAAVYDKWKRAYTALICGVDLVVELPVVWSVASAQRFALGAMSTVNAMGCVNSLSFGCECANEELLRKAATLIDSDEISLPVKEEMKKGVSYPTAVYNAVLRADEECAEVLKGANNTLAVEYIRALQTVGCRLQLLPVERNGACHDSKSASDETASASYIRQLIENESLPAVKPFVPSSVYDIIKSEEPFDFSLVERAMLSRLRRMTAEEFAAVPDVREGLENRIFNAVKSSTGIEQLCMNIKSKRYTLSGIRRMVLCAYLGITTEWDASPPYIRVLGFNEKGKDILRLMRKSATLPVVMTASDVFKLGGKAQKLFELESTCTDLYSLGFKNIGRCAREMTENTIRL